MQQVTVGTKYQIVIPKAVRKKIKGIKPGSKVTIIPETEKTFIVEADQRSWSERTLGITKEAWKNIDTTKYLEDLRNEWDKKT